MNTTCDNTSEKSPVEKVKDILNDKLNKVSSLEELKKLLYSCYEILKDNKDAKYGCHCDLGPDDIPDKCVLESNKVYGCIFAKILLNEGKDKWSCKYWRPILNEI